MKKISSAKSCGHTIIIELLSESEAADSPFVVSTEPSKQAYVRDIGPLIANQEKPCGLNIGDRVLLQGTYVPLPIKGENGRALGVVDLHNIKAVLMEEDCCHGGACITTSKKIK